MVIDPADIRPSEPAIMTKRPTAQSHSAASVCSSRLASVTLALCSMAVWALALSGCGSPGPHRATVDPVSLAMRTPNVEPVGVGQNSALAGMKADRKSAGERASGPRLVFPSTDDPAPQGGTTPGVQSAAGTSGGAASVGSAFAAIDFSRFPSVLSGGGLVGTGTPTGQGPGAATTPAVVPSAPSTPARASTIPAPLDEVPQDPFDRLVAFMSGSFSSEQQSLDDRAFFDIRLQMARIWVGREAGPTRTAWLYVEQAMSAALDKPYRQRVYRVTQVDPATFRSEVFELPGDPLRFAGSFASPAAFDALEPGQLSARAGCDLVLRVQLDGTFEGATNGRDCPSTLRGASYATSEARVTREGLVTWDRGYNDAGTQVWGAVKGGYIFRRVR
jgi:hypothetical protein